MAKTSGKSTKKSGNTEKSVSDTEKKAKKTTSKRPKGSASKKSAPKQEKKTGTNKKSTAKKNEFICEFCQKPMKTLNTLKTHERNCKIKKDQDGKKDFETALIKIKDESDDERQALEERFIKREDALQKELDEMRTVLRMEIDRHHKELDMIRKVEKDVHAVADKQAIAHTIEDRQAIPEPMDAELPEDVPQVITQKAPPEGSPKAIDMIPTPLPEIPKKAIVPDIVQPPEIAPEPEETPAPPAPVEIEKAPEPAEVPVPEAVPAPETIASDSVIPSGMSKEDIEELVKSIVQNQEMKISGASQDSVPQLDELISKIRNISGKLDSQDTKIDRFNKDIKRELENFEKESNIKRMEKEMEKISDKVIDMMEDIGFSENLSVSKIPPTILEIVYQATLDDIHIELVKVKGPQDAESISKAALEEVRLKTSGSELFKFDGRKIVTDNLARSIEANHISAKQIQTTYDVLLEKLLETVPHHKAKNFKGMIKVKSQEFAVDRATVLTKDYVRIEKIVESTSQMVAAISAQASAKNLEFNEILEDIKNNLLGAKADREEIELLKVKMQERDETDAKLADELSFLKAEIEMKEQIKAKEEDEGLAIIVPGETIDTEEIIEKNKEEITDDKTSKKELSMAKEPQKEEPDIQPVILEAIEKGASSKTAIIRDTSLEEDDILEAISKLVKEKKVIEKKVGKRIKYLTLELELGEKIKAADKKDTGKKKEIVKEKQPKKKDKEPAEKPKDKKPAKKEDKIVDSPKKDKKPAEKPKAKEPVKEKKPEPKKSAPSEKATKKPEKKEELVVDKPKEDKKPAKKDDKIVDSPKKEEPAKADDKKKPSKEPAEAPKPVEKAAHVDDELPVITRKLEDLTEDERNVLKVISRDGMSISGIQSKVGKDIKRFALLRALRVLIDSGYVGIITKGRMTLYQKINVKKMDKKNKDKIKQEVK
ncbi:MAG: hypothetical protein KAJ33_06435 [Thermoplasmata archaeon]|nr:hypothetical protein [Thermoplasmata archaeon]